MRKCSHFFPNTEVLSSKDGLLAVLNSCLHIYVQTMFNHVISIHAIPFNHKYHDNFNRTKNFIQNGIISELKTKLWNNYWISIYLLILKKKRYTHTAPTPIRRIIISSTCSSNRLKKIENFPILYRNSKSSFLWLCRAWM